MCSFKIIIIHVSSNSFFMSLFHPSVFVDPVLSFRISLLTMIIIIIIITCHHKSSCVIILTPQKQKELFCFVEVNRQWWLNDFVVNVMSWCDLMCVYFVCVETTCQYAISVSVCVHEHCVYTLCVLEFEMFCWRESSSPIRSEKSIHY